ncbi:MAG: hypothetical protein ACLF0P_11190 [Thermoanaerobaculia bacterium]
MHWTETHAFDDWAAGGYGPVAPTGLAVTCAFDLLLANDTIGGTETFRAETVITLGPALSVDGTAVEVIAGQRVEIGDGTVIGGSFRAGVDPDACSF